MSSKKAAGKSTTASNTSVGLRPSSGGDTTWIRDRPPAGRSAPGDALYETLEDFVLDQSEVEESSDDAEEVAESESGNVEQSRASNGGGEGDKATYPSSARNDNDGDATDRQTSRLLTATAQRKRKRRVPYAADEEIVLYLLHKHVSLQHSTRADMFKRVLPDRDIIREKGALIMQWSRFKDVYTKRFAKLSAAELAEHTAWKKKIDEAMKDAGVASHGDGKQGDDSDAANDQASQFTTPKRFRETRAGYTADHDIVLYILYGRKNLDSGIRTEIFNHVFRAEGIVRNTAALGKHWGRFKAGIQKRFASLSPEQLAEHEAWKQEIDRAIRELNL